MDGLLGDLKKAVADRQAVFIVGAGVSLAATGGEQVASWQGLLKDGVAYSEEYARPLAVDWAQRSRQQIDSGDVEQMLFAAESITSKLGGTNSGNFRAWLRKSVGSLKVKQPAVLKALADLGVVIATTNYDDLLEQVSGRPGVTWMDGADVERVIRGDDAGIVHLHGYWHKPESVILGIRSYDKLLGNERVQVMQQALRALRSIVLVGFGRGLADPNFGGLLQWTRSVFGGSEYPNFRLAQDNEIDEVQRQHDQSERIHVLGYGKERPDLAPFLQRLWIGDDGRGAPALDKAANDNGREPPETALDPLLAMVRQQLVQQLERATTEMIETGAYNELPNGVFYRAKEFAVRHVKYGGKVRAVNILDHREWIYKDFAEHYLAAENLQILERKLQVERFCIGTLEQLDALETQLRLINAQSDRVTVRRVYIDSTVAVDPAFDRDIAFHETEPESLTEGLYEQNYLAYGRVTTKDARAEADLVFNHLERYSPKPVKRTRARQELFDTARRGWERVYAEQREGGHVWGPKPTPLLAEYHNVDQLIREAVDQSSDGDRSVFDILDLGSGDGTNVKELVGVCSRLREHRAFYNVRFRILGVDFSDTAVMLAKMNLTPLAGSGELQNRPRYLELKIINRDIAEDVGAVTDSVDLICCFDMFSHLHPLEIDDALTEWHRVLKPGGLMLLNAYHWDDETRIECEDAVRQGQPECRMDNRQGLWWYEDKIYRYYDEDELRRRLANSGLRLDRITRRDWIDQPHAVFRPHEHRNVSLVAELRKPRVSKDA